MPPVPFPFQLAAIDLDGTLLGPDHQVSPENAAALAELQARGVIVAIASGRRYQNSRRLHRSLGLKGPIISCQGGLVIDPDTEEVFAEHFLPAPLASELIADGEARGYSVIYYHRHRLCVARRDHWVELYESRIGEPVEIVGDLRCLEGAEALKIVWYGEPAEVLAARPGIETRYRDRADVIATDPENLEFMLAGIDKGVGLRAVLQHHGIALERTVAFGDSENDVPMLRLAGLGVAMDGGTDLARQAAKLIAPPGPPETSFARAVAAVLARFP